MATHSSILAWKSPWMEEGLKESDTTEQLSSRSPLEAAGAPWKQQGPGCLPES